MLTRESFIKALLLPVFSMVLRINSILFFAEIEKLSRKSATLEFLYSKEAVTAHAEQPERIDDKSALAPVSNSIDFIKIDFPDPVSPVITVKPPVK
jgi:hypothetical protein